MRLLFGLCAAVVGASARAASDPVAADLASMLDNVHGVHPGAHVRAGDSSSSSTAAESFLSVARLSSGAGGAACSRLPSGICMNRELCPGQVKEGMGCNGAAYCCDFEVDCSAIDLDAALEHNRAVFQSTHIWEQITRVIALPGDNGFNRESGEFLCRLQKESQIRADGKINTQTLEAVEAQMHARRSSWRRGPIYRDNNYYISVSAESLWPTGSTAEKRAKLKEIVLAADGRVNPNGETTVIGMRGLRSSPRKEETVSLLKAGKTQYRDTYFVLPADESAAPSQFPGATYSGQTTGGKGLGNFDIDRDGANDIGVLKPGDYDCAGRSRNFKGRPVYTVRTPGRSNDWVPVWRDTSHDGLYDLPEKLISDRVMTGQQVSADIGAYATAILFHPGAVSHPRSVGCQTMTPTVFEDFMHALGESSRARVSSRSNPPGVLSGISVATKDFNYVLIDARKLLIEQGFAADAAEVEAEEQAGEPLGQDPQDSPEEESEAPAESAEEAPSQEAPADENAGLATCDDHPSLFCRPGKSSCAHGYHSGECRGDTWCCKPEPQLAACDNHPDLVCRPGRSSCSNGIHFGECRGDTWCCK